MKIIQEYPPNFKDIKKKFDPPDTVVFTYGDTIYNPHGGNVDEHLLQHETTHSKQQGDDPKSWWDKYIADENFRVNQEIEAYHKQFISFIKVERDRNRQARFLYKIAGDLSSEIYGGVIDYTEAAKRIKNG